ncbi:MAG: hypothetical protein GEU88_00250 [Solirubrobacterales bacterium]|nr:hypothetical protein [Solirubrobacterales bacterium]
MSVARVWREIARIYRRRQALLIGAAALVFVPVGLIGALDHTVQRPLQNIDSDDFAVLQLLAITGLAAVDAAVATLGNIFYGGVIAAVVVAIREGRDHSLAHVARTLPYWRLLVIDVVITLAVAVGLVLLIVPGLFLLARLVLAPAVEKEGLTVRGALRRSWRLTRGHALRVLALVLPIMVVQGLLSGAIQSGSILSIGDTFLGDWLGSTLSNLITAPFFALAIVVCFHELRDLGAQRAARADPQPAAAQAEPATPRRAPRPGP